MIRDMMLYHIRDAQDPGQRAEQARAFVDLLTRFAMPNDAYRKVLESEAAEIDRLEDWYFLHDNLGAINTPVWFHEFVDRAAEAGLAYIGPAVFPGREARLSRELTEILDRIQNRIRREQYLDFLSGRMFKRSLFCRKGLAVRPVPTPDAIPNLYASALARPEGDIEDLCSDATQTFRTTNDDTLSTNRPLWKAALSRLAAAAPRTISFEALRSDVAQHLSGTPDAGLGPGELASFLLLCLRAGFLDLLREPFEFSTAIAERPVVSPLARLHATQQGDPMPLGRPADPLGQRTPTGVGGVDVRQEGADPENVHP